MDCQQLFQKPDHEYYGIVYYQDNTFVGIIASQSADKLLLAKFRFLAVENGGSGGWEPICTSLYWLSTTDLKNNGRIVGHAVDRK